MSWCQKISSFGKIIAYHATVAGSSIVQEGFKTREQLNEKSSLGGGTSNSVSFTTDWNVAKGIFDSFLFASTIANSSNPLSFIKQHFNQLSSDIQGSITRLSGDSKKFFLQLEGKTYDGVFHWSGFREPLTKEEIEDRGWSVPPEDPIGDKYFSWIRPMDDKELDNFLYSYLKSYYSSDSSVYNPVFFGTKISNFRGVQRQDIGIISVYLNIDPSKRSRDDFVKDKDVTHRYVGSMAEIRVFDLSIIQIIDFDTNPGANPKHNNKQYLYFHSDQETEIAVNNILKFMYTYYRSLSHIFEKFGISIDGFISVLQYESDNMNNLYRIIYEINSRFQTSQYKNILRDYSVLKNNISVPKEIKKLLSRLPEHVSESILRGESSEKELYNLYDTNKVAYDEWWSSGEDSWSDESVLNEWSYQYGINLNKFKRYGIEYEQILKQHFGEDINLNIVSKFLNLLNSVPTQ